MARSTGGAPLEPGSERAAPALRHPHDARQAHRVRPYAPLGRRRRVQLRRRYFNIDAHGLLRRLPHKRYWHVRRHEPLPRPQQELERWLAGRRVGQRGGALFWFTPTPAGAYRQDPRLDDEDAELWRSLPGWFRERHQPGALSTLR